MIVEVKKPRKMPKGGRKGGAIFPRIGLDDAVAYARKLVSKTHVSAQPADIIYSGVVGAKGGIGNVRISALKQYGFLTGDTKVNYAVDELAKKIVSAPQGELVGLYRESVLKPTVFRKLFDTYHGDVVTKAKLKQRVADLKVHPDEAERCVELYISSMATARMLTVEGDRVTHVASSDDLATPVVPTQATANADTTAATTEESSESDEKDTAGEPAEDTGIGGKPESGNDSSRGVASPTRAGPRAVFNVNVTLDSSMDIEKLQKQLELLKRFGAI
jgi:hypothetical protein